MNTTLITSALVWERGLEFEEDRRRTQQREPSANNLAPVQRLSKRERVPVAGTAVQAASATRAGGLYAQPGLLPGDVKLIHNNENPLKGPEIFGGLCFDGSKTIRRWTQIIADDRKLTTSLEVVRLRFEQVMY